MMHNPKYLRDVVRQHLWLTRGPGDPPLPPASAERMAVVLSLRFEQCLVQGRAALLRVWQITTLNEGSAVILVTGATGTVGRHVVAQLATAGWRVRALVRAEAAGSRQVGPRRGVRGR
jgi:hypothetical protein